MKRFKLTRHLLRTASFLAANLGSELHALSAVGPRSARSRRRRGRHIRFAQYLIFPLVDVNRKGSSDRGVSLALYAERHVALAPDVPADAAQVAWGVWRFLWKVCARWCGMGRAQGPADGPFDDQRSPLGRVQVGVRSQKERGAQRGSLAIVEQSAFERSNHYRLAGHSI